VRTTTWKEKATGVHLSLEINLLGHDLFFTFLMKKDKPHTAGQERVYHFIVKLLFHGHTYVI
jgi:hypothetical protein